MPNETTTVSCWICGKPIPLEDCKTDDHGHVVHENCYAEVAVQKKSAAAP
jgi:hypothetical protein